MRKCSNLTLLYIAFPSTCWRDCLFSTVYSCLFCCGLIDLKCVDFFPAYLFYSTDHVWYVPIPFWFDCCSFVVSSEVKEVWYLQISSSFSRLFWLSGGLLSFHTNFKVISSNSVKNALNISTQTLSPWNWCFVRYFFFHQYT